MDQLVLQNLGKSRGKAILTDHWQSLYPSLENNIKFPAQYTIMNNPIDNTIIFQFTHFDTNIIQSCEWSESYPNNGKLHLYLSPDTNNELFNIYNINISSK